MIKNWELINCDPIGELKNLPDESKSVVVLSSFFNPEDKLRLSPPLHYYLSDNSIHLLEACTRVLKVGGVLFVYGLPHDLAYFGKHLSTLSNKKFKMIFKYWITLDIDDAARGNTLKPNSQGLLMFLKSKSNSKSPSPFILNTDTVRVPYSYCFACNQNVKDWGGKKHLMNPKGASLSDVWRDLPRLLIKDHIIPNSVLDRIFDLTENNGATYLHIIQSEASISVAPSPISAATPTGSNWLVDEWNDLLSLKVNEVYQGECISFLDRISSLYPEGVFDMAFADPPYNLSKGYNNYEDTLIEEHYINWCDQWLEGMVKTLKPGGSLFILNLPKWAVHHAAYLNQRLEFRHWITWDALSDPRGKLMPAHYALLYYTKPGSKSIFNYSSVGSEIDETIVLPPDSPKYCLRASCIKKRKRSSDNEKVELSDVWFDIHRIKHKRDRDKHPCQLPEKLLERIILLTTNYGGLVFDPFCGAGTTAIAARKLERNFVVVDIDPNYVSITREKLDSMEQHADIFGTYTVPRQTVKRKKAAASKKEVELYLQNLARQLRREPTIEDIENDNSDMLKKIDSIYPTRLAAIKRSRIVLKEALSS
jgi:site-specific DNA-methyltransferase (adenine-specific)